MVRVQVMWEEWADRSLPLPAYQTAGAAGADLCANFPPDAAGGGADAAADGAGDLPDRAAGGDARGVRDADPAALGAGARSTGITLPNTPGTIDSDYRGPLGVSLINLGAEPYTIRHGDRVAQAVVAPVVQAGFAVVEALDDTARGAGGFGSTGQR